MSCGVHLTNTCFSILVKFITAVFLCRPMIPFKNAFLIYFNSKGGIANKYFSAYFYVSSSLPWVSQYCENRVASIE